MHLGKDGTSDGEQVVENAIGHFVTSLARQTPPTASEGRGSGKIHAYESCKLSHVNCPGSGQKRFRLQYALT